MEVRRKYDREFIDSWVGGTWNISIVTSHATHSHAPLPFSQRSYEIIIARSILPPPLLPSNPHTTHLQFACPQNMTHKTEQVETHALLDFGNEGYSLWPTQPVSVLSFTFYHWLCVLILCVWTVDLFFQKESMPTSSQQLVTDDQNHPEHVITPPSGY
jgi:hypothetical protein